MLLYTLKTYKQFTLLSKNEKFIKETEFWSQSKDLSPTDFICEFDHQWCRYRKSRANFPIYLNSAIFGPITVISRFNFVLCV